jgi:hypothetical protein
VTPFTVTYVGVAGTPAEDQYTQAADMTAAYLEEYIRSTLQFEGINLDAVPITVTATGSDPVTISFEGDVVVSANSPVQPTQEQIDTQIQTALMQPSVETLLLMLQSLGPNSPFSSTTSVTYAADSQAQVLQEEENISSNAVFWAAMGASSIGFMVGAVLSLRVRRRNQSLHRQNKRHYNCDFGDCTLLKMPGHSQRTIQQSDSEDDDDDDDYSPRNHLNVRPSTSFVHSGNSPLKSFAGLAGSMPASHRLARPATTDKNNKGPRIRPPQPPPVLHMRQVDGCGEVEIEFHEVEKSRDPSGGYFCGYDALLFDSPFLATDDDDDLE